MYTKKSTWMSLLLVRLIAIILLMLSTVVLIAWHDVQRETAVYSLMRAMAYSTAICFLLTGVALLVVSWRLYRVARALAATIMVVAAMILLEFYWFPDLAVNRQLMLLVLTPAAAPVSMAWTTAFNFLLMATTLFLLSSPAPRAMPVLIAHFIGVVAVTIAIIGLLIHIIGHLPAFDWMVVRMAIPTALGFLLAVAGLMIYSWVSLNASFKQLNFLGHILMAFGFIALIYIAMGAIVLAQIESMTDMISQPLDVQVFHGEISAVQAHAKRLVIICLAGFLGVGLLVAYLITHRLSKQLQQLRQAMLDIAHKQEDVQIPFLNNMQEIGDMARALAVFAANMHSTRRMEERMRQIIEAAPNGIVMVNHQGLMEVVNRQAEVIFGYERAEMLGEPVEKLIPQHVAQSHPHHRNTFFIKPEPRAMGAGRDLYGLRKDGSEFPVEIGLAPISTDEGMKVLASIVDISERKRSAQLLLAHQRDLEKSNRDLARINKELETFAYVASHDLKSPLRGIAQLSSWIDEDLQAQEYDNVPGHTKLLRSRILRMEKLLDDLLIFYRAGKMDTNQRLIDVRRMAVELFEMQNFKPSLRLVTDENLPVFTTLATPFEQVLRNLLSNAIKHHDKEEGVIRISCRDLNEATFEFSVCDDGPGIPEQYQQRIFGMFQTLKPRDEVEGSGMGLALIKKIIENYGGEITVQSAGRGTCFVFTWPKYWEPHHG